MAVASIGCSGSSRRVRPLRRGMRRLDRLERSRRTTPIAPEPAAEGAFTRPRQIPNSHPFLLRHPRSQPGLTTIPIPHFSSLQIRGFLKNKQWETRVAAAKAVSFICEGIHHATVADIARLGDLPGGRRSGCR